MIGAPGQRRRRHAMIALAALAGLLAVAAAARAIEPEILWILKTWLGGGETISMTSADRALTDRVSIIWTTDEERAVAFEHGQSKTLPGRHGMQRFALRCGNEQWPLFTYFKRNRNHYSEHRVACRADGDALRCDLLSSGANPAARQNLLVTEDARACFAGSGRAP